MCKEYKFREGGIAFLLAVLCPYVAAVLWQTIFFAAPEFLQSDAGFWLRSVVIEGSIFVAVWGLCRAKKIDFAAANRFRPFPWKTAPLLLLLALAMLAVDFPLQQWFSAFLQSVGCSAPSVTYPDFTQPAQFVCGVFVTGVIAAICEETAYRGAVLGATRMLGKGWAVAFSAVTFALMHASPWQTLHPLLMGAVLAWVALTLNSTWASILVHAGNNVAVLALSLAETAVTEFVMQNVAWVLPLGLVLMGGILFLVYRFRPQTEETEKIPLPFGEKLSGGVAFGATALVCILLWIVAFRGAA